MKREDCRRPPPDLKSTEFDFGLGPPARGALYRKRPPTLTKINLRFLLGRFRYSPKTYDPFLLTSDLSVSL